MRIALVAAVTAIAEDVLQRRRPIHDHEVARSLPAIKLNAIRSREINS